MADSRPIPFEFLGAHAEILFQAKLKECELDLLTRRGISVRNALSVRPENLIDLLCPITNSSDCLTACQLMYKATEIQGLVSHANNLLRTQNHTLKNQLGSMQIDKAPTNQPALNAWSGFSQTNRGAVTVPPGGKDVRRPREVVPRPCTAHPYPPPLGKPPTVFPYVYTQNPLPPRPPKHPQVYQYTREVTAEGDTFKIKATKNASPPSSAK